jgi:hypothetical protein
MQITKAVAAGSLILMASLAPEAGAQSIAQRVASVRDGKVRMTFAARPDLCGWGMVSAQTAISIADPAAAGRTTGMRTLPTMMSAAEARAGSL